MPSRNIVKDNLTDSYYHVYACGANKQEIFSDDEDYWCFLSLMDRYLSTETPKNPWLRKYEKLYESVEVLAYCLKSNHLHLMIYQLEKDGMSQLMRSVMSTYSRYFNKKYGRTGPLIESRYRALRLESEDHILHVSRHIHLDPEEWAEYPYSSIRAYLYDDVPAWLSKTRLAELCGSAMEYRTFLAQSLSGKTVNVVGELADSSE